MAEAPKSSRSCLAIVLAAGEGKRMRSSMPKVLHAVAGRSMLAHVLESAQGGGATDIAVVIGPDRDDVAQAARTAAPQAEIFVQTDRLGTAHAVLAAKAAIARGYDDLLVLFADTPLVEPQTLLSLRQALAAGAGITVLGFRPADPFGYGRLLTDDQGALMGVREQKDATPEELAIGLCNAGIMAISGARALEWLEMVRADNAQKEFYLTDLVAIARRSGATAAITLASAEEVMGVNDKIQLAEAEAQMQRRLRRDAMREGVTMIAPETVFLSWDTRLAAETIIEPHVVFAPGVVVERACVIHAFSHLEGAQLAQKVSIGPYARLRPGARLETGARIGNFVEIKQANIGVGAKVNHLSYIGDADIGAQSNIGAGVITCNYDGFLKYRTSIGAGAFIGSNSSLVAPVSVGDGAYIGSGSVVTKSVAADSLGVGRARQMEKAGWAISFRAKMAASKNRV